MQDKAVIQHTFILEPIQQQRPRATRFGKSIRLYDPKRVKQFKQTIAEEAMLTYRGNPLTGSLAVTLVFYRPVQQSLSKVEKQRRIDGRHLPVVKPDLDNYIKSFLDALHGIYWQDDALITDLTASKRYGRQPRIEIEVKEIEND
ncbi:RusA family crossover junction endodeoxyribonuclease [Lactiplantibacillus brownii]|uniref:RusA family crossover junction endodeoxyribonuclease n=1 Tax=Lactiplantibacillus brownii TaxID=3069269 RepID=UPI0038B33B89